MVDGAEKRVVKIGLGDGSIHPGSMAEIEVGEVLGGGGVGEIADDGSSDVDGGRDADGVEWKCRGKTGEVFWDGWIGCSGSLVVVVVVVVVGDDSFVLYKLERERGVRRERGPRTCKRYQELAVVPKKVERPSWEIEREPMASMASEWSWWSSLGMGEWVDSRSRGRLI